MINPEELGLSPEHERKLRELATAAGVTPERWLAALVDEVVSEALRWEHEGIEAPAADMRRPVLASILERVRRRLGREPDGSARN